MASVRSRWIPAGGHVARASSAWVFTGIITVIAALLVAGALLDRSRHSLAIVLTALTLAHVGWAIFWRPRLHVGTEAITVVNPWRTDVVPWSALVHVDTKYYLTLVTRDRQVQVQAAPSPGGIKAIRTAGRPGQDGAAWDRVGNRAGDDLATDSGGAAAVVRGHWRELVESGQLGDEEPVAGRWDTRVIASTVLLAGASVTAWIVATL